MITQEFCRRGHLRTQENTYAYVWQGQKKRACKICRYEYAQKQNVSDPKQLKARREYQKTWREKNRASDRASKDKYKTKNAAQVRRQAILYARERNARLRQHILNLYGRKCARCNFSDERALQLDHKKGFAKKYEFNGKKYPYRGVILYSRILLGELPQDDFQLLCANCNWIKRHENGEFHKRLPDGAF